MNKPHNPSTSQKAPTPWYQEAFDEEYLTRYAYRDRAEARRAVRLALNNTPGLPKHATILDLCCGAGRHLAAFAEAGHNAIGGDLSMPLLEDARQGGFPIVRLDMRRLPFEHQSFHMVGNFFTAFGYFEDDDENYAVFDEVARVIKPAGSFFFDFLNHTQALQQLADRGREDIREMPDGDVWVIQRRLTPGNRRAVKFERKITRGRVVREIQESVRLFTPAEIGEGLGRAGLTISHQFGNYDGAPFDPHTSERLIVISRKN